MAATSTKASASAHLWYGTEAEDLWGLQPCEILKRIWHELQGVGDQEVEAIETGGAAALANDRSTCGVRLRVEGPFPHSRTMGCRPSKLSKLAGACKLLPSARGPDTRGGSLSGCAKRQVRVSGHLWWQVPMPIRPSPKGAAVSIVLEVVA